MLTGYCPQTCNKWPSCFPSFLSYLPKWLISTLTSAHQLMDTRMWEGWEDFNLPLCVCSRLKDSSSSKYKFTYIYICIYINNCFPLLTSTCVHQAYAICPTKISNYSWKSINHSLLTVIHITCKYLSSLKYTYFFLINLCKNNKKECLNRNISD